MKQTWRWFGPDDNVSVSDIMQAGAAGIVTALHHIPDGEAWTTREIEDRKDQVAHTGSGSPSGLNWDVVESLPVSEEIKQQRGEWRKHIVNYKESIRNLAAAGIETVCYNFMPVLDWTRTDLGYELPNGAKCMRFDLVDCAVFDIHILARPGAIEDFAPEIAKQASRRNSKLDEDARRNLVSNIVCGLPGAGQGYTLDGLKEQLDFYGDISDTALRQHQIDFLAEVVPVAEKAGVRLCCHPDDPPFPLLGLPRIMSTEEDYDLLTTRIDSPSNGITLCSGSLGVRVDNDLPGMVARLGDKVHFIHLRNVFRETEGAKVSFHEAAHLEGRTDMVVLIQAILAEESRRAISGRKDASIPFRPDHGQQLLYDLQAGGQPGYPAVGRLRGLAELRGIIAALSHPGVAAA